jgi:ribokinase
MESQILVLGAINQDEVARVERHPVPGETVVTDSIEFFPGGKGANQAHAAAISGEAAQVRMIGSVGDDPAGIAALAALRAVGVDVSLVRTVVGVPTGRAYITVSSDGQNSIVVGLGANAYVSPSGLPQTTSATVLVAQTEVGSAPVEALGRLATASGARLIINDGPVVPLDPPTLAAADPLIVNEHEAAELLGDAPEDPIALATGVREACGSRSVVVTLGARGSVIADAAGVRHHAAVAASRVVDTTGAGDTFVGRFAAAVAAGADNDTALERAAAAAAKAVTWRGARPPAPRPSDSERLPPRGRPS